MRNKNEETKIEQNMTGDSFAKENQCIMRHLSSVNFTIATKSIKDLEATLKLWLTIGLPGGMVIGRPRTGKTRSIYYIAEQIKKEFGADIPIIIWNMTEHANTEKNFYTSLLMAMGMSNISLRRTALALKERLINQLTILASESSFRKVVLFIDEANKMTENDFDWLGDLYNTLNRNDIQLTAFLVGTEKLSALKSSFISKREDSTIGRFMAVEVHFAGISDKTELKMCLLPMNQVIHSPYLLGKDIDLLKRFFPNAAIDGKRFSDLTDSLWSAFEQAQAEYKTKHKDIPMKYFLDTITNCLMVYGKGGPRETYFPTQKDLRQCIELSGFRSAGEK